MRVGTICHETGLIFLLYTLDSLISGITTANGNGMRVCKLGARSAV